MPGSSVLFLIGNTITLLIGLSVIAGWFRHWFKRNVTEPIERLQKTVEETQSDVKLAKSLAQNANDRLDRHLEGHANG